MTTQLPAAQHEISLILDEMTLLNVIHRKLRSSCFVSSLSQEIINQDQTDRGAIFSVEHLDPDHRFPFGRNILETRTDV